MVVAIAALVVALTGVAFAAGGLTKKQEKQVVKIAKKYAGKDGVNGVNGAPGSQGPKGDQGARGDQGAKGDTGDQGAPGGAGEAGFCSLGNTECVLPPGATLTGAWSFSAAAGGIVGSMFGEYGIASLSFPLKVQGTTPQLRWIGLDFWLESGEEYDRADCPGSAERPEAEPGFLCVYATVVNANSGSGKKREPDQGETELRSESKAIGWHLFFPIKDVEKPAGGVGTWAVTASCPEAEPECLN